MQHKHSQSTYNGKPWNDDIVDNNIENELDNQPKWYRECKNNNHDVGEYQGEYTCWDCDKTEIKS